MCVAYDMFEYWSLKIEDLLLCTKKYRNPKLAISKASKDLRPYDLTKKITGHLGRVRIWDMTILSEIPI